MKEFKGPRLQRGGDIWQFFDMLFPQSLRGNIWFYLVAIVAVAFLLVGFNTIPHWWVAYVFYLFIKIWLVMLVCLSPIERPAAQPASVTPQATNPPTAQPCSVPISAPLLPASAQREVLR